MPYICPAFSSKRRISSISRYAVSSCSLLNFAGALWLFDSGAARLASGLESGFSVLVLATAILSSPAGSCPPISRYWACAEARARERVTAPKVCRLSGFCCAGNANGGRAPRLFLQHQREVARVQVVEHRAGALIEHVGIEIVGAEQRDLALEPNPFCARALDLDR